MGVYHAFSVFIQSWMTPRLILLFESRGVKVKNRFCFVRPLNERDLNTIEPILNVRTPWVTTPSISDSFFRFQKNQRCGILRINISKFGAHASEVTPYPDPLYNATYTPEFYRLGILECGRELISKYLIDSRT